MDKVIKLIKSVETLLRSGNVGGKDCLGDMLRESQTLFEWFISQEALQEAVKLNTATRTSHVSLAVKLHNKARNLTSATYAEIKPLLKAVSAAMLSVYSDKNPKIVAIILKLFSKAAQELQARCSTQQLAYQCCITAVQLWANNNSEYTLERVLPPIEYQEVKIAVFQTYMDTALLSEQLGYDRSIARTTTSRAMEMVQSLPVVLKISFASQALLMGTNLTTPQTMSDATHYFSLALAAISSALLQQSCGGRGEEDCGDGGDDSNAAYEHKQELLKLRTQAQLSLAYAFMETK